MRPKKVHLSARYPKEPQMPRQWYKVATVQDLPPGRVTTVLAGHTAVALVHRLEEGFSALDNRCPHQGGPLGEGQLDGPWLICPWHGYEYDPASGDPPEGYGDCATSLPLELRGEEVWVEVEEIEHRPTVSDQMVQVMTDWGVDAVFGMVGHSNLGFADAMRRAEEAGRLRYFGVRHEGAASFAASAYGKLTGRPAACFAIAGPGATNLLTGLWDAKMDRAPVLALTGQVNTQVIGPGTFQEVDLAAAFAAVSTWSQTVLKAANASDLMALALKHALIEQGVGHLILPDEVQSAPALDPQPPTPKSGRISGIAIRPAEEELARSVAMIDAAQRPSIILGHGARQHRAAVLAFAEQIDAAVITTFKGKGIVPDDHPLGCGVLGRSGTPVGSSMMGASDLLIVLGASFSNHTGISVKKPTIQVDIDRMTLGKFHPVDLPIWGEIGTTLALWQARVKAVERPKVRASIAQRWDYWRARKRQYCGQIDAQGRMHPALVFEALQGLIPADAVICVDVGNNTYSFGRYFESRGQDVLMSGYLGSIGFALPAAMGAWAAVGADRPVVSISGDGGLGQYLADFTTLVKYNMPICHIVLNNGELGKISKEQRAGQWPVWQTSLVNPGFAEFARLCGGQGSRASSPEELRGALAAGLSAGGPAIVEVMTDPSQT
jgi:thiamine pyrophosphate-dependent acetolactate synthase large subunit-like protein/nitrite reductase/ring-hydroxylating ferredoxin subunit